MNLYILSLLLLLTSTALRSQDYPVLLAVKGGVFLMGANNGNSDEKPAHEVTVSSFQIARTETTVKQWLIFCNETGRRMPEAPWFGLNEDHPIVNVSWDDAISYCYWLSTKQGRLFDLPTEAEWEFSARGGLNGKGYDYSGSQVPDSVGWIASRSNGTMPVAQKLPNELGIYDMTGNVWEWCSDWYNAWYYTNSPTENPRCTLRGKFYTLRGGAFDIGAPNSRNAYRNPLSPSSRNHNKGFRVVSRSSGQD